MVFFMTKDMSDSKWKGNGKFGNKPLSCANDHEIWISEETICNLGKHYILKKVYLKYSLHSQIRKFNKQVRALLKLTQSVLHQVKPWTMRMIVLSVLWQVHKDQGRRRPQNREDLSYVLVYTWKEAFETGIYISFL